MLQVRVVDDRFTDGDLAYKLETLSTHLELGDFCAVCNDSSEAWAGYVDSAPARGDTVLTTGGNLYAAFTDGLAVSASIGGGDIVCIQSTPPGVIREFCKVDSVSGDVITLTDPIRFTYPAGSVVLVRHRDFHPAMRAPASLAGTQIVTSDHRISFTLDLTLEEAPDLIQAMESAGGILDGVDFSVTGAPGTLEAIFESWTSDVQELGESYAVGTTARVG